LFFQQINVEGGFKNTTLLANYMTQPKLDNDFPVLTNPTQVTRDFRDKLVIQTATGNKSPILITRISFSIYSNYSCD